MRYSFASITKNINYGNKIIEFNVLRLLEKNGFSKPDFIFQSADKNSVDRQKEILKEIETTDFLIVPGCTTLTVRHYPNLEFVLSNITKPVFNLGAAFAGNKSDPGIDLLEKFSQPIGVRDPFTKEYLTRNGIENVLIGCPTLFTGNNEKTEVKNSKNVVFFLGFETVDRQLELIKKVSEEGFHPQVVIQEESQREYIGGLPVEIIEYDVLKIIYTLKRARMVVSARLHGALPALACGVPLFFIEAIKDTRFSLLDYLGVDMHNLQDKNTAQIFKSFLNDPNKLIAKDQTYQKIAGLRLKLLQYIELIKKSI